MATPMSSPPEEKSTFSLFHHEEEILQQADQMVAMLDQVAQGVRHLAESYRLSFRGQSRLLRMSDRMQLDLQKANQKLARQAEALRQLNVALAREAEHRKQLSEELQRLAMTDDLTGMPSRRSVLEAGSREIARSQRHGQPLCFMMMDLDQFKAINDRHGHAAGDDVLTTFSRIVRGSLREIDEVGRLGGEEFLVVLPDTRLEQAVQVAERIRRKIERTEIPWKDSRITVTVSIGIAFMHGEQCSLDQLISRADRAMYAAKSAGRNRVMVTDPQTGEAANPPPEHDG